MATSLTYSARVVLGCDGLLSPTRRLWMPDAEAPTFKGNVALRGRIPTQALRQLPAWSSGSSVGSSGAGRNGAVLSRSYASPAGRQACGRACLRLFLAPIFYYAQGRMPCLAYFDVFPMHNGCRLFKQCTLRHLQTQCPLSLTLPHLRLQARATQQWFTPSTTRRQYGSSACLWPQHRCEAHMLEIKLRVQAPGS